MECEPTAAIDGKNNAKRSYDSCITGFEAEFAACEFDHSHVNNVIRNGLQRWESLRMLLEAKRSNSGRAEAARKLITNHEHVLRDVINKNPCSQLELARVDEADASTVDVVLRETARRLLKSRPGADELEEILDVRDARQVLTCYQCGVSTRPTPA